MTSGTEIALIELFDLVWDKPVSRVAAEFGVSDTGLADICRKHGIPTPSRGHWTRVAAGKTTVKPVFPGTIDDKGKTVTIHSGFKMSSAIANFRQHRKKHELALENPEIPKEHDNLHSIIRSWLGSLKEKNCSAVVKSSSQHKAGLGDGVCASELDLFRLRVTSSFLTAVENAGARIVSHESRGRFKIEIGEAKLVVRLFHKLSTLERHNIVSKDWTAWPEHHQIGHFPTNDLKFSIDGRFVSKVDIVLGRKQIENGGLRQFVACVLAAGDVVRQGFAELREEAERKSLEEKQEREKQSLRDAQLARWNVFERLATEWEKANLQRQFLAQIASVKSGCLDQLDTYDQISRWQEEIALKIDEIDPFKNFARSIRMLQEPERVVRNEFIDT